MRTTAARGRGAAMVVGSDMGAYLHRTRMRFEAFGTGERGNDRPQLFQRCRCDFLNGYDLNEVTSREPAPQPCGARSGEHVIWARAVITGRFGTEGTEEN